MRESGKIQKTTLHIKKPQKRLDNFQGFSWFVFFLAVLPVSVSHAIIIQDISDNVKHIFEILLSIFYET